MSQGDTAKKKSARRQRHNFKGVNTRERIMGRAAQLFSMHSYADVGLQKLAAACGLSKAALFTHFRSKRQLYVACVGRVFSQVLDAYTPSPAAKLPNEKLRHFLAWLCPFMSQNRLMSRLVLRMVLDQDVELVKALLPGSFGRTHDYMMSLLRQINRKKDLRAMAFFVYTILTLYEELLNFADVWMPCEEPLIGGLNTAAYVEKMIKSW